MAAVKNLTENKNNNFKTQQFNDQIYKLTGPVPIISHMQEKLHNLWSKSILWNHQSLGTQFGHTHHLPYHNNHVTAVLTAVNALEAYDAGVVLQVVHHLLHNAIASP